MKTSLTFLESAWNLELCSPKLVCQCSLPIVGNTSKRGVQDSGKVMYWERWYRRLEIGHDQDEGNKALSS